MACVSARLCKLQKGCTRLSAASDKVYQLLSYGRWFSPGIPASSVTKTGRHAIVELLLKVALNTKINQSINLRLLDYPFGIFDLVLVWVLGLDYVFNSTLKKTFLLNQCGQFVWWRKSEYQGKSPYRRSVTYILDHTKIVSSTPDNATDRSRTPSNHGLDTIT